MTLIVVSGAPGTGKSTIAAALGAAMRFPMLSLDPIKEALAATVTPLRLGAGLIEADTGAPDAVESAVTAVRSALSL